MRKSYPRLNDTQLKEIVRSIDRLTGELERLRFYAAMDQHRRAVGNSSLTAEREVFKASRKCVQAIDELFSDFQTHTARLADKRCGWDDREPAPEADAGTVQPSEPETGAALGVES